MRYLIFQKRQLPNMLSVARIACAPVMLFCVFGHYETPFVVLFIIAQITDILDGYLARKWKLESELGARLDSYADLGSYVCGFYGAWQFHRELFSDYGIWLAAFAALYVLNVLISKLRYDTLAPGLHLYSSKITAYLQGIFLVVLFAYGLVVPFFILVMICGYISELENIIINSCMAKPVVNAKGIFWLRKEGRWK